MGVVLTQQGHPLSFFSKQYPPKLRHGSAYFKEMSAIIEAVKKWWYYPVCRPFTIITDHQSLRELVKQKVQTPEQQKYLKNLLGYDFDIVYRPDKNNIMANTLSRLGEETMEGQQELNMISFPVSSILSKIREARVVDEEYRKLRASILTEDNNNSNFSIRRDLIV